MKFVDFEIRAWQIDETHVQVMVHSSPSGDMYRPTTVPLDPEVILDMQRHRYFSELSREAAVGKGRALSEIILPRSVQALLTRSLEEVGPESGLRLRLCLDEALVDLPWELLYVADESDQAEWSGFLALDPRISIVRGAATTWQTFSTSKRAMRLTFAGMLELGEQDCQQVRPEYQRIAEALQPVEDLLTTSFVTASQDQIEAALAGPVDIFHYSGYTVSENGRGFLVKDRPNLHGRVDESERLYSERLADLLSRARTRLAFFNALDSKQWAFMEPMVRAGIPLLIGMHGATLIPPAIEFAHRLYASLAIGVSVDEAVIWARQRLVEAGLAYGRSTPEWAAFTVYMPTSEPVLLPRPRNASIVGRQEASRRDQANAVDSVKHVLGRTSSEQQPVNRRDLRKIMIQAFSREELNLLCADLQQDLADDGIELLVTLELAGGEGKEEQVLNLISYLDRRGFLYYLVTAVRRERPGMI